MDYDDDFGYNDGRDERDDFTWQDEENMDFGGPRNDGFGFNNQFNNRGGFRRGRNFGPGRFESDQFGPPPPFFGPRGPPGPSGPPFMWGRGFGPGGPPMLQQRQPKDNSPRTFLIRCGVPKETLKGIPKDVLRSMKPQYCGICNQEFDSYVMSRLHYISKNHIKKQKKYLTQRAAVGSQRPKEIPLKCRELYCELCDVHITSKTHADSHYAGKPHRAIVDGRKQPKNPFLLQRGMGNRIDQLIRREKKNLKPVEPEEDQEANKKSKPTLTELFCDICQTSVTCTEQMTMHLNGKRHLSKEKQHILRMMKGQATETKEDAGENDNVDKAEDAEGEGEGEVEGEGTQEGDAKEDHEQNDEDEQNKYDWGNGSGTWDDDVEK